jgi:Bacterial Ig-like domain (group 3)/FG-GAP-like repeat
MPGTDMPDCSALKQRLPRSLAFILTVFSVVGSFMCTAPVQAQSSNFLPAVNYSVPGQGGIAIGDFNADGIADIAIANGDGTISILLGNGDGTFQPQYTVAAIPASSACAYSDEIAAGDFNNDDQTDLAVLCTAKPTGIGTVNLNGVSGSIEILLNTGNGNGVFGAPTEIPLEGTGPAEVLASHFGRDANLDLAVLYVGSRSVGILRGSGNGMFQTEVGYLLGSQPNVNAGPDAGVTALAIGDLNGDGYADLAVAAASGGNGVVSVLLGNGDGTFGTAANWIIGKGSTPSATVIGDFNGDGKADVAVNVGAASQGISVLLGNGDGTFQTPALSSGQLLSGSAPGGLANLAEGDWNGSGKTGLALAAAGGNPDFVAYLGKGDSTFPSAAAFNAGPPGQYEFGNAIAAADFNGDGYPDVVLAVASGNGPPYTPSVSVLLNCAAKCSSIALTSSTGNSAFNQPVTLTATVTPGCAKVSTTPTGSVTFEDADAPGGPATLGTATLSAGIATFAYSELSIGNHFIVANYAGDNNFVQSTSASVTQVVSMAQTTTSLTSSTDPSLPGSAVTFTATVTPATSGVPTGTVVFSDNGTQLVSQPLDAIGSATFATSSLSTATHSIEATYSGDANFAGSASSALTQIIGTDTAPFALSSSAMSSTVSSGESAMFTITAASVPQFRGIISFSCSGLPVGAGCVFNPSQIAPNGGSATTTLTIMTSGEQSGSLLRTTSILIPAQAVPFLLLSAFGMTVLLVRKRWLSVVPALSALALLSALTCLGSTIGCGGGSVGSSRSPITPAGSSQVIVNGSSENGAQSVAIDLTVN